jgi:hypothetical protein
MNRRLAAMVGATLAVLTIVLAGPRGAQADDGDTARDLLDHSREAAADTEFTGTVVIEWVDGGRHHERKVSVEMADGVLHLGKDRLLGSGSRRLLRANGGWELLWTGRPTGSEPDPTGKYRFVVADGSMVAQRPTTVVTIRREGQDGVRERLFFDDATGMMMRRDQLDAHGKLVRRYAFVRISEPKPRGTKTEALPKVSGPSVQAAPLTAAKVPDDLDAPKRIGKGFVLSGVYAEPDGMVQLYYSDGLLAMSVFERAGELDWDALPAGGSRVQLGDVRARVYRTAAGTAVVWDKDGITYTTVTDAPLDEVAAVAGDLPRPDDTSMLGDVGRFVTAPFSWG